MNPHELSPWSMFLSADVLVKAVMIGLAFASLMTWTIFLAKSAHLFLARRGLRKALARVANTRTLTEAQLAAGRGSSLPASLVAAAIHEVRISSESTANGIQARAASRFAEIVRAEARSARYDLIGGMPSTDPSDNLHELELNWHRSEGVDYALVRIRLFANLGAPTYLVVAGSRL